MQHLYFFCLFFFLSGFLQAQLLTEQVIQLQPTYNGPIGAVKVSIYMKPQGTDLVFKCSASPVTNLQGIAWNGKKYSAAQNGSAADCVGKIDWVASRGIRFSIVVNGEKIKRQGEGMIAQTTAEYPTGISMFDLFNQSIYSHSSADQQKFKQMLQDAFNDGRIKIVDIQPKDSQGATWSPSCTAEISKLMLRNGSELNYSNTVKAGEAGNPAKEKFTEKINGVEAEFISQKTSAGKRILLIRFKNTDPRMHVIIGLAGAAEHQSRPIQLAPGETYQRSFPGIEKIEYTVSKINGTQTETSLFNQLKKWMEDKAVNKTNTDVKNTRKFEFTCMCIRG